jgi:molybdopterin-synthase adenylyltransferase
MTGSFAIIGAGGLGGPIATALAAAGARLTIVDPDVVDLSNLQRQVQFVTADVGRPKAVALAQALALSRPGADARWFRPIVARWAPAAADALGAGADVIVDGTDDPATKFAIADWAVAHGRPYVIAGALRYGGNAFAGAPGAACYRCLFEAPPPDAPTCADAGILGPVCALIGGLAAREALRLAAGDRAAAGAITVVEDVRRAAAPRRVAVAPRPGCRACAAAPASTNPRVSGAPRALSR